MYVDPKEELRISQSVHFPKILCVKALSLFVVRKRLHCLLDNDWGHINYTLTLSEHVTTNMF